jgi:hypothetical protein
MTSSAWTEMQTAIGGALRLACGDRAGLGAFDASIDGFWRSFRAALVVYPLFLVLVALRVTSAQWETAGVGRVLTVETIGFAIAWTAFPLLILQLTRMLGCADRFLRFMVAYNWSQIPQTALITIVALDRAAGVFPAAAAQFAELTATLAVLLYEWYIARVALAVTGAQATLIVVLDLVLGTALGRIAQILYHPGLLFGG